MMQRIIYILFIVLITQQSCVDSIFFETDSGKQQLVLYGLFTQFNEKHVFSISRTSDFGKQETPVSGALVIIADDLGNSADYEEIEPGKYVLAANKIQGIPGRSYHIEINFADGRSFFSTPQVMPEPIEAEDIYFEIESRQILSSVDILIDNTFINIFIDTPLQYSTGESAPLRWKVEEVYSFVDLSCGPGEPVEICYFNDAIRTSDVLLFNNKEGSQEYLRGFKVRSRLLVPFSEFGARHYFIVHQYTMSIESFEYWEKIKIVANQSGSLFDVQPAKVGGNIVEVDNENAQLLGYFEVSSQDILRTFITPLEINPFQRIFNCKDLTYARNHQPECCKCKLRRGNHIERPTYWDED